MSPERLTLDEGLRVVIDTNLWISFLIGKRLASLLEMLEDPWFELVSTQMLHDEIINVAKRDKFRRYFTLEKVQLLEEWMREVVVMVELGDIPRRCRDPKDDYLLELAVQSNAIYLVSGDDDLLSLGSVEGCKILTVDQFEAEWNLLRNNSIRK